MRKNYIFALVTAFVTFLSNAQVMPIDFSDNQDVFVPFGGSNFAFDVNPNEPTDDVGAFVNNGNDIWEGFFIDFNSPINLSQNQVITLSFYQSDSNIHNIYIKLENGTEADVEVIQTNSSAGWTDNLTFDFSNATISGTATNINAQGSYSRLTIFIDGGIAASGTYLIDDISDGSTPQDPNELDVIYTDLVWSDEFDSTTPEAIDNTKWHHQTIGPNGGQWFNGELQHYTDRLDNSFIENGFLKIVAKKETLNQNGVSLNYTSARLNSKFAFTYGRVDVRAKLPEGGGTWPAIWTLGKNINEIGAYWQTQGFGTTSWPACGEIDIMEHGLHSTNEVSSAIHTPSSFGATVNTDTQLLSDVANNFHVYSMNWSPNQITFMIDGVGYYTYNPTTKNPSTWPFDLDQYLILNIAMGGISGPIDSNFTESDMVIDYVRVYQNTGLGIDDNVINSISVYPNPAKDFLYIRTYNPIDGIEIYNNLGQLMLKKEGDVKSINLQNYDTGMYLLKIWSNEQSVIKKVFVN